MAEVLRTPRMVPVVNMQSVKAGQSATVNDEVAAILKGLKLDKHFFLDRLRPEPMQELVPTEPSASDVAALSEKSGRDRQREEMRRNRRRLTMMKGAPKKNADFDIYLNEAVMPVLAQALDALCRQLARMKEQGDTLDPKVRARFNPLSWLGQQLLRRHPKCARTPRRAVLYRSFKDWSDWEKGRREMLRKRETINEVFNGFMLRGFVENKSVPAVVSAIDDMMCLQGVLKNKVEIESALKGDFSLTGDAALSSRKPKQVQEGGLVFEEFWYRFGTAIMRYDIVPNSLIVRGSAQRLKEEAEAFEWRQKQEAMEEERDAQEAEMRRLTSEYSALYDKLMANEQLQAIMQGGKILTGDDVREGDVGYEYEAPPHGAHIQLLADFMVLLGIEGAKQDETEGEMSPGTASTKVKSPLLRASAKAVLLEGAQEEERYWDEGLAKSWTVLQKVHRAEMHDGVVEGELLKQVLVPPVGFNMLKAKVEYEIERREEAGGEDEDDDTFDLGSEEKPTKEQLCARLGMTMARLDWLHKLFESYLQPDSDDPDAPAPCCLYPECPASLNKEQMRNLVSEVEPNLSKAQFEARFKRLDQDGSGLIEFDEFAMWVNSSDVRITGNGAVKMTFEELSCRYQEPLELIKYLHSCFQDQLPDGVVDNYPENPVGLPKQEAVFLAGIITPSFDKAEFAASFELVDQSSRENGHCDFDEFIELLDLDDLPAELRDRFEEN